MNHRRDWTAIVLCVLVAIALIIICATLAPYLPGGK